MKHLSVGERWIIYALLQEGYLQKDIAIKLWRSSWTISKEIRRNSPSWRYEPYTAQVLYEDRRSAINKGRRKLSEKHIEILKYYLIERRRAPHSISGRRKIEVCTQTLYNYIYMYEPKLKKYLKYKNGYKKRFDTRGRKKTNFRSIEERPPVVEYRDRVWDVEIDTIHSSWGKRTGGLVTVVDRKSKYLLAGKVSTRSKKEVGDKLIDLMRWLPKQKLHTITSDNGKEFNDFARVEFDLDTPVYFANPYASYERWTNEQTNGMIRVFYPKWTDFSKVSIDDLNQTVHLINHKPRKSLWYKTAFEVFYWVQLTL
jgi:IS30 family transposase